jgi:Mg2+/Co2+ transporter CorC
LLMEIQEKIPRKGEKIIFDNLAFVVESADSRKIKRVKMTISRTLNAADESE